jgi:hypothetical protein
VEHALAESRTDGDARAKADAVALQGMLLHYRAIELPPDERDLESGAPFLREALELLE